MQERASYHFQLRRTVALAAKLIFVGLALGVITLAVSPLAAVVASWFALWVALVHKVRTLHKEQVTRASAVADLTRKQNSTIVAMAATIGLKDDMTAGHALRVSDLASILAQQMQVSPKDVQVIQRATVLADIGKLEIAQSILSKEGKLSEDEWMEMRRHPELGSKILTDVLHLGDAGDIVLAHHERFDGNGYPRGLKGDDIPLGARIFAVADSYIAMTSDRPHRKKMSHDKARREILRSSMSQFDPEVVSAFARAAEQGLIESPSESVNADEPSREPVAESKLVPGMRSYADPVIDASSSATFRIALFALFALLGVSILALWLLVRPTGLPDDNVVVVLEPDVAFDFTPGLTPDTGETLTPTPTGTAASPDGSPEPTVTLIPADQTSTPTPVPTATPAPALIEHVVVVGDSWIGVAAQFGVDPETLASTNGYSTADILPLITLIIPQ